MSEKNGWRGGKHFDILSRGGALIPYPLNLTFVHMNKSQMYEILNWLDGHTTYYIAVKIVKIDALVDLGNTVVPFYGFYKFHGTL